MKVPLRKKLSLLERQETHYAPSSNRSVRFLSNIVITMDDRQNALNSTSLPTKSSQTKVNKYKQYTIYYNIGKTQTWVIEQSSQITCINHFYIPSKQNDAIAE